MRKKVAFFMFVAALVYAVWNGKDLILGPQIEIYEPISGSSIKSKPVLVKGVAKKISFISLNGRQIYTNNEGLFSEEILPRGGYNVSEIIVQDRFGKKKSKFITFYYDI